MAGHPPAGDLLQGAPAQPFTAGSRPVDWLQANRAWRNLDAGGEQSLPQGAGASQSSSSFQPGPASNWTLPQNSARPAAGIPDAAPFTSSFPNRETAAERQEKRKFHPDAERTKAAGLSGSSLLFSNSSSSHALRSFLQDKGVKGAQTQPASQGQASAMPSASDSMQHNGGPGSMHSHHGQKRSASAASLGAMPRKGSHDASAASNGNDEHASSIGNHGWTRVSQQDHLKPAPGNFAASDIPETAPFEADSSRPSSASAQPQAQVFMWPQAFTTQASMQSSQAAGRPSSANSGSAMDPSKPGSIHPQAGMSASFTAGTTDRAPGRVSRAGWSGSSGKAPVAAASTPASSVYAVGQSQQDQVLRNAGLAAGAGRGQGMTGAAKDSVNVQAPFVFGSTGTPCLPSQAKQIHATKCVDPVGQLASHFQLNVNRQHLRLVHVAAPETTSCILTGCLEYIENKAKQSTHLQLHKFKLHLHSSQALPADHC